MKDVIKNYQTAKQALLDARSKGDAIAEKAAQKAFHKAENALFTFELSDAPEHDGE